jgi:uncharacterized membrane protein
LLCLGLLPCSSHALLTQPSLELGSCQTHHHHHLQPPQDLKESLNVLGSLSPDTLVAVELLWTPQERGDAYSKDELLLDYPSLVNL